MLKFENKLRDAILSYETELKVHLDEYFKMILQKKGIGFKENLQELYCYNHKSKNYEKIQSNDEIFQKFDNEWRNHITKFSHIGSDWNDYFYLLIKILTFGTINNILDLAVKQENGKYRKLYELFHIHLKKNSKFKIGNKLSELKTIGILRNSLCHKESLVIFLEKGFRETNKKSATKDVLKERIESINNIYKYYREISGNKKKELDKDCWIIKYADYRLRNGNRIDFKRLKINL